MLCSAGGMLTSAVRPSGETSRGWRDQPGNKKSQDRQTTMPELERGCAAPEDGVVACCEWLGWAVRCQLEGTLCPKRCPAASRQGSRHGCRWWMDPPHPTEESSSSILTGNSPPNLEKPTARMDTETGQEVLGKVNSAHGGRGVWRGRWATCTFPALPEDQGCSGPVCWPTQGQPPERGKEQQDVQASHNLFSFNIHIIKPTIWNSVHIN